MRGVVRRGEAGMRGVARSGGNGGKGVLRSEGNGEKCDQKVGKVVREVCSELRCDEKSAWREVEREMWSEVREMVREVWSKVGEMARVVWSKFVGNSKWCGQKWGK